MINRFFSLTLAFTLFLGSITQLPAQKMPADADPVLWQRALSIHRKAIIVDGHNDITSPMVDEDFDLA
ncbi:hypothetical protein OFM15_26490, partial [Escherichia coli]|nr:hypothetical protein [Escherichia coli]